MARRLSARLLLPLILLVSFGARLAQLDAQSLWYDESVSLVAAQQPAARVIMYATGDMHPPLYNLLLHAWIAVAGPGEFAARFLSVMLGMLIVALAYRLARDWFGRPVAILTAALIGASSFNLWYAQEARMYILAAAGALLSLVLFARLAMPRFNADKRKGLVIAYAGTLVLALYAHYYILFLWVFEYAWGVVPLLADWWKARSAPSSSERSWRQLRNWHLVHLLVLLLFAPWLPVIVRQTIDPPAPPWRTFVDPLTALAESLKALAVGQLLSAPDMQPIVLAMALVYLIALVYATNALDRVRRFWLAGATVVPIALVLAGSLVTPLYYVRYVFIYSAAFYIVLAAGIGVVWQRSRPLALAVLMLYAVGSWYAEDHRRFDTDYAKDGYRRAVAYLSARVRPGDAILINAGFTHTAFDYYYAGPDGWRGRLADYRSDDPPGSVIIAQTGSLEGSPSLGWGDPSADYYLTDAATTMRTLDMILSRHARLWVLQSYDEMTDPQAVVRRALNERATKFDELSVPGTRFVRVQGYLSREAPSFPVSLPTASMVFDRRLALLGWTVPVSVTAGHDAALSLLWEARAALPADYRYSLRLYDRAGHRWAQADGPLAGALYPASQWGAGSALPASVELGVPAGTPPGDYEIRLAVYDPATSKELPVPNSGTQATLGRLRVERTVRPVTLLDSLPFQYEAVFGDRLALDQHTPLPAQTRPGDTLAVEVRWRALQMPRADTWIVLQISDANGTRIAEHVSAPVDGIYPTTDWVSGELVRDPLSIMLPANLPDGRYAVSLAVNHGEARASVRSGWSLMPADRFDLGTVELRGRPHTMQRPAAAGAEAGPAFGDLAELAGVEAADSNRSELSVTLYWQARGTTSVDYKVFLHLIGPNGRIVAQSDGEPGGGALRTTSWISGEYLTDRHVLPLGGVPPGSYTLRVGLYNPRDGARLPVVAPGGRAAGDHWDIDSITLR